MKDPLANFIRFGAVVAIFAGALMGFADIYHAVAETLITEYSGSPTEQVGSIIFLIGRVLVVCGLPALYLHHASSAGKFGFIAFTVAMLGNTLMVASDWNEVFIAPILRGGADLTLKVLYRIMDELDDLLLPYIIDLSIFDTIGDPDVIEHIQRVGVTFYDKSEAICELAA